MLCHPERPLWSRPGHPPKLSWSLSHSNSNLFAPLETGQHTAFVWLGLLASSCHKWQLGQHKWCGEDGQSDSTQVLGILYSMAIPISGITVIFLFLVWQTTDGPGRDPSNTTSSKRQKPFAKRLLHVNDQRTVLLIRLAKTLLPIDRDGQMDG